MNRKTLTQYLVEQQRTHQTVPAEVRLLIETVARACKSIGHAVSKGALGGVLAKKWADVRFVLTDVNERAAALAERNLKLNGLDNFEVVCGDGFPPWKGRLTGSSPTRPSAPASR